MKLNIGRYLFFILALSITPLYSSPDPDNAKTDSILTSSAFGNALGGNRADYANTNLQHDWMATFRRISRISEVTATYLNSVTVHKLSKTEIGTLKETGQLVGPFTSEGLAQFRNLDARPVTANLKLWVNAFIPRDIENLTITIPGSGPYGGRTAIKGPASTSRSASPSCYLTDQRGFSSSLSGNHRMQSLVEIDLISSSKKDTPHTDATIRVQCSTGAKECEEASKKERITVKNFSVEALPDGNTRYFFTLEAAANNPCVEAGSPDIDWKLLVIVLYDRLSGKAKINVDGFIEPFPAFEMYAILNGPNPTTIFQEKPIPGSTPWNLPGSPNRAVTVIAKEVA